jgi:Gas vesicle synthesis protein GvpL/GvpF
MSDGARACYVYCVVPSGQLLDLEGVSGVEPGSEVSLVTHDDLSAVVSSVRLEGFGSEALKRNLEDIEWLERTARAHDAVLGRALAAEAVVPLRLCTLFADVARVRGMLGSERGTFLAALDRLRGRAEWSVKLLAERRAMDARARERTYAGASAAVGAGQEPSRGREYFARKKLARAADDELRNAIEAAAGEIHSRLSERAADATLLRPQSPEVSRRAGQMVLNGAYLVDRAAAADFTSAAQAAAEYYRAQGIELELSGPWAPYNFVTRDRL